MEKRVSLSCEAALLTALCALIGLSLFGTPAPAVVRDEVLITGWLHVSDDHVNDAILVVELEGEHCLYTKLEFNGRFAFTVPVNAKARLVFLKPGHLPKEVEVDTRNALNTPKAERMNRKVEFDVVLESEEQRPGRRYDGPVGSITFVNGTGTMKVRHDLQVVADGPAIVRQD